jgi:uncharacterized YccA/Bax inhibitor family protein
MANPVIRDSIFSRAQVIESGATMTTQGTINKTGFLLLILTASSMVGWNLAGTPLGLVLAGVGAIGGLILAITLTFKPQWATFGAPTYAVLEGLVVGAVSAMYDHSHPGIASNALILTFGILALMLALYHFKILRATARFTRTVILATMGIFLLYMVDMIMGLFGTHIMFINSASPVGILFSVAVAGLAAMNLIIDFGFVEQGVARQAPKYMEWYAGFTLLVTLVWLYLEALRLLNKLNKR